MQFIVPTGDLRIFVRIAVPAAIEAGIVCTYIPGLDAAAAISHSLVLNIPENNAVCSSKDIKGNASRTVYPIA